MIIPVIHRIIIKADKLEETDETFKRASAAGIVIPDNDDRKRAQAGVDTGTVVSVGATAFRDFGVECPVKEGDYIAYARFAGKHIKDPYTNEQFIALNDEDVISIFRPE